MKNNIILVTILPVFLLWYVMFVLRPFNFWLMMSFSTLLLTLVAFCLEKPLIRRDEWNWQNVGIGILSAAALYVVFELGNQLLMVLEHELPFLSRRSENLHSIYANRGEMAAHWNALLLFFPIGFGEEVYWRGLVQKHFSTRLSKFGAFFLTTAIYTAVHISTGNVILILAALTCGLFWGGLYMIRGSLLPVLVSHMLWDPFVFVIRPIM